MSEEKGLLKNRVDGRRATVSAWTFDENDYVKTWNISYFDSGDSEMVATSEFLEKFEGSAELVHDENPYRA